MEMNDMNEAASSCEEKSMSTDVVGRIFDRIADSFQKMTIGIVRLAFVKLPARIFRFLFNWKRWLDILRFLKRFGRAVFWVSTWLLLVQAYFITRHMEEFLEFWRDVWCVVMSLLREIFDVVWPFLERNLGIIWTIVALLGSVYGILYVTLKKRAQKRGDEFHGVFRRKAKKRSKATEEIAGSTAET